MKTTTLISSTLGEDSKCEPPLGPLYIASALEQVGWSVDFRDYQLCPGADVYSAEKLYEFLTGHQPILMISCFVDMLPVVLATAEMIKSKNPNTYIVLGGPGPSAGAADIIRRFPTVDAIVRGEGEETITEWASSLSKTMNEAADWQPIAGMVMRNGHQILDGGERPRMTNVNIPRPAYHLLDWSQYTAGRITTTRGCPYNCSFCDVAPLWGRKAVYQNLASVVDEIVELRDCYGVTGVAIADDTFVLNRDRVREFCHLLIDRQVQIEWGCFARINLMSEDLVALMARAGCRGVFYGIDSGSPNILKQTLKELDADTVIPTLRFSAKYFEFVEASFIWGYPFERLDDFLLTLEMAADASYLAPIVNVQLHMLSPLPNSPMYKSFSGTLRPPDADDRQWLLLPGVLIDERAAQIRDIIKRDPALFPGFFTFPTPDKAQKLAKLRDVVGSMERTIGRVMTDDAVYRLMEETHIETEAELLHEASTPSDRIGTGLALGVFSRTRRYKHRIKSEPLRRPPAITRQRNDVQGLHIP